MDRCDHGTHTDHGCADCIAEENEALRERLELETDRLDWLIYHSGNGSIEECTDGVWEAYTPTDRDGNFTAVRGETARDALDAAMCAEREES